MWKLKERKELKNKNGTNLTISTPQGYSKIIVRGINNIDGRDSASVPAGGPLAAGAERCARALASRLPAAKDW